MSLIEKLLIFHIPIGFICVTINLCIWDEYNGYVLPKRCNRIVRAIWLLLPITNIVFVIIRINDYLNVIKKWKRDQKLRK